MAITGQTVFAEVSDNESINTTTTEEDYDPDKEYDVECVLAEQLSDDGQMYYLIKWEGYPLYDCTWETKRSITHDIVLQHWEADNRLIRQGQKQPFDVNEYYRAFEEHHEAQDRKRRLRRKKRRQRGLMVTDDDEEDSSESYELPTTETPKRTRVKAASPIKRKGVAQPVPKRRNTLSREMQVEDEIRPTSQDSEADSLFDSLFGEPIDKPTVPMASNMNDSAAASSASNSRAATSALPNGESAATIPVGERPSTTKPTSTSTPDQRKASTSKSVSALTVGRKSAPGGTIGKARPASKSNVFANWTKPKQLRQRPRVSGETPKDSKDPKFTRLSIQNRYQKYSKNEPAPNFDDLVIVDPKTGNVQPPKSVPMKTGLEDIHSAYGRRSPPRARQRTPSPPSSPRTRPNDAEQPATANTAPPVNSSNDLYGPGRSSKTLVTCNYWREGRCRFASDTCRYVHAELPYPLGKKQVTCHYWAKGYCNKRDEDCEFLHQWVDEIAGQPGTFRRKSMSAVNNVSRPDVGQMRISPPTEQSFTPASPVNQVLGPATTAPPTTSVQPERPSLTPLVEPATDPRLRGRAPRVTDSESRLPEQPQKPTPIEPSENIPGSITQDVEMTDAMDESHISPEQYLEMVKHGIDSLDPTTLLFSSTSDEKKEKEVREVYIHMPGRPKELRLLEKYFMGLGRRVFTSNAAGAWKLFSEKYSSRECLLVVHPTELFLGSLPGLSRLLTTYGSSFRIFSIGVQREKSNRENRKPVYEAQRLFPHGGITFITDDVFVNYPEKATQIIEEFLEEPRTRIPGAQMVKIGARPGIKNWLFQLAVKKMEVHAGDGKAVPYVNVYDAICRLCPITDEDPTLPEKHVPLESSFLWSPSIDSTPSFQGRWESGDEEGATDFIANFFGGEACWKAWKYRKFYFVYQRPEHEATGTDSQGSQERVDVDPKGWGKRYSHIYVATPDHILQINKKRREQEGRR
jgi:hypothetical protein